LDDQIFAEVVGFDFASLFPPQPNETRFVITHYDPSV
jgi:hypothetical protein